MLYYNNILRLVVLGILPFVMLVFFNTKIYSDVKVGNMTSALRKVLCCVGHDSKDKYRCRQSLGPIIRKERRVCNLSNSDNRTVDLKECIVCKLTHFQGYVDRYQAIRGRNG